MQIVKKLCFILGAALIVSACSTNPPKLLQNVSLGWTPTFTPDPGSVPLNGITSAKFQFQPFKDVRQNPQLIAENREEATPKPVTTQDSVGAYVANHMQDIFRQLGLLVVNQDSDVIITGEVRRFFVEEVDTYRATVILHVEATNRSGKVLWRGLVTAAAKRVGHSYSMANYNEAFSNAVTDATIGLLKSEDFRNAVAHNTQ